MDTIDVIRVALLITLPITLLAVLYKRFKQRTMMLELPAPLHVELIGLEVAYHPVRLKAWLKVPEKRSVGTALLDAAYHEIHRWNDEALTVGEHHVERTLPVLENGGYYFQVTTNTQRTVRRVELRQA